MKSFITYALSASTLLLVTSCSPESANLIAARDLPKQPSVEIPQYEQIQAQEFQWITEDGGQSQLDFNPQVDILFVTDNSESMKSAQDNLVRNIDRFTAGISKNRMIDYHIGVISTWDAKRYAEMKNSEYQVGELRYIKDAKGQSYNKRFVTKNEASMIASTLQIGVSPYSQGGPEIEEFFSPLSAALEKSRHGDVNDGFFREQAQLVVIFLTDADDSTSRISPEQMARSLVDFKGGKNNKVSVYGVLVRPTDKDEYKDWDLRIHPKYNPQCFDMTAKGPVNNGTCSGFGPKRLEELILLANENLGSPDMIRAKHIMSIVSKNFGSDLARLGDDITVKTLAKEIFLNQRPRVEQSGQLQVRVRYGTPQELSAGRGQVIPQKSSGGWVYDPENNSVHLSGEIKYEYKENGRFSVSLIPLTIAK